jgi:hypothetical protein
MYVDFLHFSNLSPFTKMLHTVPCSKVVTIAEVFKFNNSAHKRKIRHTYSFKNLKIYVI